VNDKPGILCFGEVLWDMLPDGRVASGAPMNVALRLVQSGYEVRMLSRAGADPLGEELLAFMAANGLPTGFMQLDETWPTGTVEVDTTDPRAPVFDIVMPVAWDFIDADEYLRKAADDADVLVFGSLAARHTTSRESLVRLLPTAGLRVLDVNFRPPHEDRSVIELLLHHADWAKVNETELAAIARWHGQPESVEAAARDLVNRYRLSLLCITLGENGAMMIRDGKSYRQEAFAVDVVDTVGCGDAFLGTLVAGLLADAAPPEALARAAAAGALVASSAGATPPIDDDDIRRIIGDNN
jgi:fructokinase